MLQFRSEAFQIHRVNPSQNLSALPGQHRPNRLEPAAVGDPAPQRLPAQPGHQKAFTQAVAGGQHMHDLRFRNTGCGSRHDESGLGGGRQVAAFHAADSAAGPSQAERFLVRPGLQSQPPGFLAGATGQPLGPEQRLEAGPHPSQQLRQLRLEFSLFQAATPLRPSARAGS